MPKPYTIPLASTELRKKAFEALKRAPDGYRVTFEGPKRSNDQNRRMWAMLGEVSRQVEYYGQKRTPDAWKDIFSAALREVEAVPSIDGRGIVQIGLRTSKMTKAQMSDLMELITAYGAEHGVVFKDQAEAA